MLNSTEHKFQLLIKTKMLKKYFLALKLSDVVFMMLLNVKMPKMVIFFYIYYNDNVHTQWSCALKRFIKLRPDN